MKFYWIILLTQIEVWVEYLICVKFSNALYPRGTATHNTYISSKYLCFYIQLLTRLPSVREQTGNPSRIFLHRPKYVHHLKLYIIIFTHYFNTRRWKW